jgi:hypothetical protein
LPKHKYITARSYASNPWMKGCPPPLPTACPVGEKLQSHLRTMPANQLQTYTTAQSTNCSFLIFIYSTALSTLHLLSYRLWVDHTSPRLVTATGINIRQQLVGEFPLDHELGTALIRRWAQINRESNRECPYMSHKHVMHPDFAVIQLYSFHYLLLCFIHLTYCTIFFP